MSLPVVTRSASSTLGTRGAGLTVAGAFAYLARGTLGLQVVDIRHPDAPRLVGLLDTPSEALLVTTAGDRLYVLDRVATLQVVQGPGADLTDTDGDGVSDFFDAFPTDPTETQDTDRDRLGDTADPDDDNDGFADTEEQQATSPTDATDARSFPVRLPPVGTTTLVVDAASALPPRERTGTPAAPYRALSEALQALRTGSLPQVHTVQVRAGTYSGLTTQESFPLDLSGLVGLTLQGEGTVVLDAGLTADVFTAAFSRDLIIEGLVITRGVEGIDLRESTAITIRNNHITGQSFNGISIGVNSTGVVITENLLADNGRHGLQVSGASEATVTQNTMRHNSLHGISVTNSRVTIGFLPTFGDRCKRNTLCSACPRRRGGRALAASDGLSPHARGRPGRHGHLACLDGAAGCKASGQSRTTGTARGDATAACTCDGARGLTAEALPLAGSQHKAAAEQIKARPAKHLAFQHLEAVDVPLNRTRAPGQGDARFDRRIVVAEPRCKALHRLQSTRGRACEPRIEVCRLSLSDQRGKVLCQVDRLGQCGRLRMELGQLLDLNCRARGLTP